MGGGVIEQSIAPAGPVRFGSVRSARASIVMRPQLKSNLFIRRCRLTCRYVTPRHSLAS